MAKFVRVNFRIGVSGKAVDKNAEMYMDDADVEKLSLMKRMGVPYVTILDDPDKSVEEEVEESGEAERVEAERVEAERVEAERVEEVADEEDAEKAEAIEKTPKKSRIRMPRRSKKETATKK